MGRVRRPGAGRKALSVTDPTLLEDSIGSCAMRRAVTRSRRCCGRPRACANLPAALRELGHEVHFTSIAKLLRELGHSMQANRKTKEGARHPDRDAQFGHINATVKAALDAGQQAISVDTKRRNSSATFATVGVSGAPRATRSRCACTTSRTRSSARSTPTAYMTSRWTRAGSASGSTPTPRSSRSRRSPAGGAISATRATPTRRR